MRCTTATRMSTGRVGTSGDDPSTSSGTGGQRVIIEAIRAGRTTLGIELGSTRIKACLVSAEDPGVVIGVGSHAWENRLDDGVWTYALADVWRGIQDAYADLVADVKQHYGVKLEQVGALG